MEIIKVDHSNFELQIVGQRPPRRATAGKFNSAGGELITDLETTF